MEVKNKKWLKYIGQSAVCLLYTSGEKADATARLRS